MKKNNTQFDEQKNPELKENYDKIGFVDGNFEDKYNAKNPISAMLVGGFMKNFSALARSFNNPKDIAEVGAGEGYLIEKLVKMHPKASIVGCDLSERVNELARERLASFPQVSILKEDAENVSFADDSFDAVICCEVLEHVEHPEKAIAELYRILHKGGVALVSVPHEPIWRMLNMARFKYVKDLGNTPGHLNHWTRGQFKQFVRQAGFSVKQDKSPFPWTMLLLEK